MKMILKNNTLSIYNNFSTEFAVEVGQWAVYNDKKISEIYQNKIDIQDMNLEYIADFIKDMKINEVKLEIQKDTK